MVWFVHFTSIYTRIIYVSLTDKNLNVKPHVQIKKKTKTNREGRISVFPLVSYIYTLLYIGITLLYFVIIIKQLYKQ